MNQSQVFKTATLLILIVFILFGFSRRAETSSYKCMIQMTNYTGERAYIAVSLMNPSGDYVKTLQVLGDDQEWYSDIIEWWKFQGKVRANIDAVTGATIGGGERNIFTIAIEDDKIDNGYKIRFESGVEDQEYYKDDVEFELTSESVKSKVEGIGFIRYVRMIPQKQ